MNDGAAYPWKEIYSPPPPTNPPAPIEAAPNPPSDCGSSPTWATCSLASSPAPPGTATIIPRLPTHSSRASRIDYAILSGRIPALYAAFEGSPDATLALREAIDLVIAMKHPSDLLINKLILHDVDEYRCAVGTCKRHERGSGWTRPDRARGHFRMEHLASHFPCSVTGCEVRCRRLSDLRAHFKSHHRKRPPRFHCSYCPKSYPKRSNLNRHIEIGHRKRAPRRLRRTGRR